MNTQVLFKMYIFYDLIMEYSLTWTPFRSVMWKCKMNTDVNIWYWLSVWSNLSNLFLLFLNNQFFLHCPFCENTIKYSELHLIFVSRTEISVTLKYAMFVEVKLWVWICFGQDVWSFKMWLCAVYSFVIWSDLVYQITSAMLCQWIINVVLSCGYQS